MTTTTEFQLVDIDKLVPYANNARTHNKEQILKLRSSLREFGFVNPVIIDKAYNVLAGHGRIEAAKEVAYKFISNRPNDNIGLTLFGGEAFTQCPITTDHATLLNMFHDVSCEMQAQGIISPGTAIGMGLANAVSHLEKSKSKSKVIILLTDGVNNVGEISPLTAADMAKENGIRVYTIAIGASSGKSKQAVTTLPNGEEYYADVENDSDPETLKAIAHTTGGLFYQAETSDKLKTIYDDIDKLEKTKLKVKNFDRKYEAFQFLGYAVLVLFLLEIILHLTIFRRMP